MVVGIGINVNNTLAEAPPEVAERAIALIDAAGSSTSLSVVLSRCLGQFRQEWTALHSAENQLVERLRTRCVLTGRLVTIDLGHEQTAGHCRGIAGDGALLIETNTGLRRLYAGVVTATDS